MSDDQKRIPRDDMLRWSRQFSKLADEVEQKAGQAGAGNVDAGAVSGEILLRIADLLEGPSELAFRLRSTSDHMLASTLNYELAEEGAHTAGYLLGWTLDQAGRPPWERGE